MNQRDRDLLDAVKLWDDERFITLCRNVYKDLPNVSESELTAELARQAVDRGLATLPPKHVSVVDYGYVKEPT